MLEQARLLNPDIPFQQGNMLALSEIADGSFAGIAAFYSIVHIPRAQVVQALIGLGWSERIAAEAVESVSADAGDSERASVPALLRLTLSVLGPARKEPVSG